MSSMFNFDAEIVAGVIQTQQTGEVFRSILDSRRARKTENLQDQEVLALQQHYDQLLARYNSLANEYNNVLAENKRVDAAHAVSIADKDRRNVQLAAENEDFRRIGLKAYEQLDEAEKELRRLRIKAGELPPDDSNSTVL